MAHGHAKTHVKSLHHPSHHGHIHHGMTRGGGKGRAIVATPANVGKLAGHPGRETHPGAKNLAGGKH